MAATYCDPDGIHDLRVEIKQLRAFFRLIEKIAPGFEAKKHLRNMRKLFKSAGDLRDIHVQQELTRAWAKEMGVYLSAYYNSLKQKELPAREKFSAFAARFELEKEIGVNGKRIKQSLKPYSDKEAATKIRRRTESQLQQILQFGTERRLQEENLHRLRILAKETRYTLEISRWCFPNLVDSGEELNNHLRGLHQALGKWHDGDVAKEHVDDFRAEKKPSFTDQNVYDTLEKKIQQEKTVHFDVFEKCWKEFLTFVNTPPNILSRKS